MKPTMSGTKMLGRTLDWRTACHCCNDGRSHRTAKRRERRMWRKDWGLW